MTKAMQTRLATLERKRGAENWFDRFSDAELTAAILDLLSVQVADGGEEADRSVREHAREYRISDAETLPIEELWPQVRAAMDREAGDAVIDWSALIPEINERFP